MNGVNIAPVKNAKGSEKEWSLLSQIFEKQTDEPFETDIEFISLWAKKNKSNNTAELYLKINEDVLALLKDKLCQFQFKINGIIYCNRENYTSDSIFASKIEFEYFGDFQSGGFAKVNTKQDTSFLLCALTERANIEPHMDYFDLYLKWSVGIEWNYGNIRPLKLTQNEIVLKMFTCDVGKDLTVVVGNKAEVKCHKQIFAAHSPVLAAMLTHDMQESATGRVELPEISEVGINLILPYFYGMELHVNELSSDIALELFQFSHKYNLVELEKELGKVFLIKEANWFNADTILELYVYARQLDGYNELKNRSLRVLIGFRDQIRTCERYKKLQKDEALELLWILFEAVTVTAADEPGAV